MATVVSRPTDTFYRMFDDVNGDHVVNAGDNLQFRASLSLNLGAFVTTI